MTGKWQYIGLMVAAVGIVGMILVALIATGLLAPLDKPSDWLGEGGVIGAVTGLLTLAGAGAAVFGVYLNNKRSLEAINLGERAELAGRFQKGVELLESDNRATRIGALLIIRDTVLLQPQAYYLSAIGILVAFLEDSCRPLTLGLPSSRERQAMRKDEIYEIDAVNGFFAGVDDNSSGDIAAALSVLSELRRDDQRRSMEGGRRLSINNIVLTGKFRDLYLGQMDMRNWAFRFVDFYDCDFSSSYLGFQSYTVSGYFYCRFNADTTLSLDSVGNHGPRFTYCDMRGLWLTDDRACLMWCDVSGMYINNGAALAQCWFDDAPPKDAGALLLSDDAVVHTSKLTLTGYSRGLGIPVYAFDKDMDLSHLPARY